MQPINRLLAATTALVAVAVTGPAFAAGVIANAAGDLILGVNDQGHLNVNNGTDGFSTVNASAVGIAMNFSGGFRDATSPGCLCEGWGVSATTSSGARTSRAGRVFGVSNLTVIDFSKTATTITSDVGLTNTALGGGEFGVEAKQAYRRSTKTDRLFEDIVTITNNTGAGSPTCVMSA